MRIYKNCGKHNKQKKNINSYRAFEAEMPKQLRTSLQNLDVFFKNIGGGLGLFCKWYFFLHTNARHSKPKVASRFRHAANIAFDLFNIFLYVIARKVRKCPLSPFVTSNVVLSCLVRMADVLARLVQKADSLSALCSCQCSPPPPPPPRGSMGH